MYHFVKKKNNIETLAKNRNIIYVSDTLVFRRVSSMWNQRCLFMPLYIIYVYIKMNVSPYNI